MQCSTKNILTIPSITVSMGPNIFPKEEPRDLITFVLFQLVKKRGGKLCTMAYDYIQYFECVKTFLGVTKGDDVEENHVDDN